MVNCPVGWDDWIEECLREVRRWKIPPNWSDKDWTEEMKSIALMAGWMALASYNPRRKVPVGQFIKIQVKAALLQRYRDEWRFASRCRCCTSPQGEESDGADAVSLEEFADISAEEAFWWRVEVRDLLARLPPKEHYLLERLFIDGVTESEVAAELRVSQPTVSRWKREILKKLRSMLEEQSLCLARGNDEGL